MSGLRRLLMNRYSSEIGSPTKIYENGKLIEYTLNTKIDLNGMMSIDTGFIPYDGTDFTLHLIATFPVDENNSQATLLNAMDESNTSYNGFCIRRSSQGTIKLYYGNNNFVISNDDEVDVEIESNSNSTTVKYLNTESTIPNYSIPELTIRLGSTIIGGGKTRYAKATIHYFSVKIKN